MDVELQNGQHKKDMTKFTVSSENEEFEIDLEEVLSGGYSASEVEGLAALLEQTEVHLEPWSTVVLYLWHKMGLVNEALDFAHRGVTAYKRAAAKKPGKMQAAVVLLGLQISILLAQARKAVVQSLDRPRQDTALDKTTREEYLNRANELASEANALAGDDINATEAQLVVQMAQEKYDVATHFCALARDREGPTSIVATLAQARIYVHEKNFRAALKEYQQVLRFAPHATPDPRIGIGYCFWHLGYRERAEKAWERSCAVNPGPASLGAQLYLGLVRFNESRNAHTLEDERIQAYSEAVDKRLATVFRAHNTNASVAACLSHHKLLQNQLPVATKLAERAVQCATHDAVRAEAHYALARALHAQGEVSDAMVQYVYALKYKDDLEVARLAAAHLLMLSGDLNNAQASLERLIKKQPDFIEALITLAAIHTHIAYHTKSSTEANERRQAAMKLYDQVLRMLSTQGDKRASATSAYRSMITRIQSAANDPDLFVEVGRLWTTLDPNKALKAYQSAISVRTDLGLPILSQLHNNVGCLLFHKKQNEQALDAFQAAAKAAAESTNEEEKDAILTTTAYNMAVVQETTGTVEDAETTYKRILGRHPEWIEAKARLAILALNKREIDQAHELLKEALTSRGKDLEIRSLYTHFLIKTGSLTVARDFAHATTKIDKTTSADLYANCAIASILYHQARESKPQSSEESKKRNAKFIQSVEYYDRALRHDSQCAYAAQGLAVALAEGAMGPFGSNMTEAIRLKNLRDALNILNKVRETVVDGSVYVNIGHCHASRDEWDRAVEAYETASKRFYNGTNIACLIYLSRAWFQKATKDQSFDAVRSAMKASQQALELNPADDTIKYNIAMIGHKGLEIISELPAGKRTSQQILEAIAQAEEAQEIFTQLGSNTSGQPTPYNVEMASQRARFGATLVNRARTESLEAQREHESTEQGRLDNARQAREAERKERQAKEEQRMAEIRERNERLAEERKTLQMDSQNWYTSAMAVSDEEEERRRKKGSSKGGGQRKKPKDEDGFVVGDDAEGAGADAPDTEDEEEGALEGGIQPTDKVPTARARSKRKKPAAKKAAKAAAAAAGDSGEDGAEPAAGKRARAVVQGSDEEDEGQSGANKRQKKGKTGNFLSAEFVESDDEA